MCFGSSKPKAPPPPPPLPPPPQLPPINPITTYSFSPQGPEKGLTIGPTGSDDYESRLKAAAQKRGRDSLKIDPVSTNTGAGLSIPG